MKFAKMTEEAYKWSMQKILIGFVLFWVTTVSPAQANVNIRTTNTTPSVVPSNGISIPFLDIAITAEDTDAEIRSIILRKTGLSDRTDVKGVRATVDFQRSFLGRVDNDDEVRLRFLRPIYIPLGQTKVFEITAHLDSGYRRTVGFEFLDIEMIGGGVVSANNNYVPAPNLTSPSARISGYQTQSLVFHALGGNSARLRYGRDNRLGRFRIQNPSRKNIQLQSILLKNIGTTDLDETFSNLELRNGYGETLAYAQNVDRKNVGFTFDNYYLRGGSNISLEIWGIVDGGSQGETIQFVLDEAEDLRGRTIESLPVSSQSRTRTSTRQTRIDDGNIQFSRSNNTNYLWNQNYNPGSRDIIFFSQNIRHKAPIFIEDELYLFVANGSQAIDKDGNGTSNESEDFEDTFEDFSLYLDGRFHDSTNQFEIINGQLALPFRGDIELYTTTNFMVTGRISHEAQNGDRLRLTIDTKKSFPEWSFLR